MIGLVAALPASEALARSCSQIQAQLLSLDTSSPALSPKAKQWQNALNAQNKAIEAVERDMRYLRCSSIAGDPRCSGLGKKLKRMQTNSKKLERQFARVAKTPSSTTRRKQALNREFSAGDCREVLRKAQNAKTKASVLGRLFGKKTSNRPANDDSIDYITTRNGLVIQKPTSRVLHSANASGTLKELGSSGTNSSSNSSSRIALPRRGTFRTLCVRTCDGFFFPVSFAADRNSLSNDEARCNEMCPASPTELFVYQNPGGTVEDMTSISGVPYGEIENAYRYKTEFVPNCQCRSLDTRPQRQTYISLSKSGDQVGEFYTERLDNNRIRVMLRPSSSEVMGDVGGRASAYIDWSREPVSNDNLPEGEDPTTLMDLSGGFNSRIEITLLEEDGSDTDTVTGSSDAKLPLISSKTRPTAVSPVFDNGKGAPKRPAPATTGIRVVGPEYYVAQ